MHGRVKKDVVEPTPEEKEKQREQVRTARSLFLSEKALLRFQPAAHLFIFPSDTEELVPESGQRFP